MAKDVSEAVTEPFFEALPASGVLPLAITDIESPPLEVHPSLPDLAAPLAQEAEAARAHDKVNLVVTSVRGIAHAVLHGPPEVELSSAVSVCGWSFGGSRALLSDPASLPACYKSLCEKCFPEGRATRKAAVAASVALA